MFMHSFRQSCHVAVLTLFAAAVLVAASTMIVLASERPIAESLRSFCNLAGALGGSSFGNFARATETLLLTDRVDGVGTRSFGNFDRAARRDAPCCGREGFVSQFSCSQRVVAHVHPRDTS